MAPRRQLYAGKPLSWWLWVGYWIALFTVTHVPMSGEGELPVRHADKAIHIGLYFLLVWLGGRHLTRTARPLPSRLLFTWAAGYAAYAAVDESLQSFVSRTMSLGDWFADVAGILLATVLLARRTESTKLSEPNDAA